VIRRSWKPIILAALAASFVAFLGATATDLGPWYQNLAKPSWQPPDWLFGPVWTLIFGLSAISGVLAWRLAPNQATREWVIGAFALNGFLNVLWTILFFRFKHPDWALIEVGFFWLSIVALIFFLARISKPAGALLLPYLAWVSFAAVLNLSVARLNSPF
jgi:tryptophan-rich sensory protein